MLQRKHAEVVAFQGPLASHRPPGLPGRQHGLLLQHTTFSVLWRAASTPRALQQKPYDMRR